MNRAIRLHATGGPEELRFEEVPMPAPARGEVLLRQLAIGVNFLDVRQRRGDAPLPGLPSGLGIEAVGIVVATGEGVLAPAVGSRVAYADTALLGAYAEHRAVPAWRAVPVPDAVPDDVAAAVLLKGMTAEFLVRRTFKVGPSHRVLVLAAAGGTGVLLCQWLHHLGASVLGVVSSREKADFAVANGCHHPIVVEPSATPTAFAAVVRRITQDRGVDVVYDSTGRATLRESLRSLKRRGLLVSFGAASGAPEPLDLAVLRDGGSLFVTRPSLDDYVASRPELERAASAVFSAVRRGVLRPYLAARLALGDAAEAHLRLESRRTTGATVLIP